MKIQIIGYGGSGKSTLAKRLGDIYDIPVVHLDNLHFEGNWQERPDAEMGALLEAFLNEHDEWVIDGNYSHIAPRRFSESDMTIFLNFERVRCFLSAWHRYRTYRGRARESCPCPEKFDRTFRHWLLFGGRTKKRRAQHWQNLSKTKGQQIVLKTRKEVRLFLSDLEKQLQPKEN